ncbi:peroxidase-related enzyme [Comamonadaceae bacterium G21597-S1]|nr:peroxidase-related enzyme [Comamonadaceae bacterium G21597-S1]
MGAHTIGAPTCHLRFLFETQSNWEHIEMSQIAPITPAHADAEVVATLAAVRAKLGMVPNLFSTLARAPAALKALLAVNDALASGRLSAAEREMVALAVSQANGCAYCVSAHTLLGAKAGLSEAETLQARAGHGAKLRSGALAAFARELVETRGHIEAMALDTYRQSGLSDEDMLEVVAHAAATTLTNYANNVARTEVDFPAVQLQLAA